MNAESLGNFAVGVGWEALRAAVTWFQNIYDACGLTNLWLAVVAFSVVFSIIIIPLRGGSDVSRGALGDFVVNEIGKRRNPKDNKKRTG